MRKQIFTCGLGMRPFSALGGVPLRHLSGVFIQSQNRNSRKFADTSSSALPHPDTISPSRPCPLLWRIIPDHGSIPSSVSLAYRNGAMPNFQEFSFCFGQDSSPIHSGLLLCLVGKTIGDTRRTRVDPNIDDEAAARAAARATCDEGTLRGTYQFFDQGVDAEGHSFGGAGY